MDKLIHTALNTMHSARLKQLTSAQNLSNAQVPGFRGDEIGGRFGSVYLYADDQLETRVFAKKSEPGLFSSEQGEMRLTGQQTDVAIEGDGLVEEYPGGYSTYLDQRTRVPSIVFTKRQDMKKETPKKKMSKKAGKLSYKDQRELDDLPGRMEIMQGQIDSLTSELSISNLFQRDRKRYDIVSLELEKNVKDLKLAEQRWLELEERKLELENQ